MFITEYDEARHMRHLREEGREEGCREGREDGLFTCVRYGMLSLENAAAVLRRPMSDVLERYREWAASPSEA